jgi:hypothetical protein
MIRRPIIAALVLAAVFSVSLANAQQTASFKSFTAFRNVVPDIDFFASSRQVVAPYEKPASEAIAKLKQLFGSNLPKGAIFVCSTLVQKDAVYEPKVLKSGYVWSLTAETPEVRAQVMLARIKSQMGGEVPAEILDRIQKMQPEMMANAEKQMVATITQQIAYAVIQTMLDKGIQYRSSRLDDMGKSPLPDWLDIGIGSYASGADSISYLKQNMDQTFPIEDVLSMARPFVASSTGQNGGGMGRSGGGGSGGPTAGGFPGGGSAGSGGRGMGGFPGGGGMSGFPGGGGGMGGFPGGMGGQRGGSQRQMSKDEQDRMLFDGQAGTFFSFLLERIGVDKVKELIKQAQEGKESREYLSKPDVLGSDFEKIEEDWAAWVKAQK